MKKSLLIVFLVLLIDQILKVWVKTHMYLGEEFSVLGNWFIIHFTENPGMAFGMEFGGGYGKLFLSVFRILAVLGIAWYLHKLIKENAPNLVVVSLSLILAGAIGNIIDSVFYGVLFSDSLNQLASFMPEEGGYTSFLHGRVVDMLYFPLIEGHFPSWSPIWANEQFMFFRPVFNIADTAISFGVGIILVFQRSFFSNEKELSDENSQTLKE